MRSTALRHIGVLSCALIACALPLPASAASPRTRIAIDDSGSVRARAEFAVAEFQAEWQRYWRQSEQYRRESMDDRVLAIRNTHAHCDLHVWAEPNPLNRGRMLRADARPGSQYRMRRSDASAFGVCPSWLLEPSISDALDESTWRDGALLEAFRGASRRARASLLSELDSAAKVLPGDGWISGQRVRFLLEQLDYSAALGVADSCRAEAWWCAALRALTLARKGELHQAEIAYRMMNERMPSDVRCEWNDVSELLPRSERSSYAEMSCESRADVEVRLWWLATPLFRAGVNERLVEQYSRRVELALRIAGGDERHAFDRERGGDALVGTVLQYGWPSFRGWLGAREDRSHDNYLVNNHRSPAAPPYTTFEYTLGRMHAIPRWRAVIAPFESRAVDWTISVYDAQGRPDPAWWPNEHFRPTRRLVQLDEGQLVFFRRQDHVEIACAVLIDHPALRQTRNPIDVMLLTSRSPGQVDSLEQKLVSATATAVLRGLIAGAPALVAIEALGTSDERIGARTRFGVTPPEPLAVMKSTAIELSAPVLLDLTGDESTNSLDHPTEVLLERMAGSVSITPKRRRIGLYWESYGVKASDTAKVSITISAVGELGALRRAVIAGGVASDPRSKLSLVWTDADSRRSTTTLTGPVPVQIRAMALDLSQLVAGPYVIEVRVALPDGREATSERRIELLP